MDDDSRLYIQTSQAHMVQNNQFDTVYHEHISFFNINSFNELVKRTNLNLIDVIKTPILLQVVRQIYQDVLIHHR